MSVRSPGAAGSDLEQRPERRDADPAGDQRHARPRAPAPVRTPYGPSRRTRVPTGAMAASRAVVAELLDGEPEPDAVRAPTRSRTDGPATSRRGSGSGARSTGRSGPRGARGRGPSRYSETTPGASATTPATRKAMAQRGRERRAEAEREHERGGRGRTARSSSRGDGSWMKSAPDEQLVQEREGDRQVGVEVEPVPGLVRQPAPGGRHRRDADHHEQAERRPTAHRTYG